MEHDWEPATVHRAATTLRRALLTQPLPTEIAMVAEDEKLSQQGLLNVKNLDDDENDEGTGGSERVVKQNWEDIVADKIGFKEGVRTYVV